MKKPSKPVFTLIAILVILLLVWLAQSVFRTPLSSVPVPTITSKTSSETVSIERSVLKSIPLPDNANLIYWDYNSSTQALLAHDISLNQLARINKDASTTLVHSLNNDTLVEAFLSPSGNKALVHVILPSGNNQYIIADVQSQQSTRLPSTVQSASWLENDELLYVYNDTKNSTLSRTSDYTLQQWQRIASLEQSYTIIAAGPGGKNAIIAPSDPEQNTLLINLNDGSTTPLASSITAVEWVNDRYALLQQVDQTGQSTALVVNVSAKTTSGIDNTIIPAAAVASEQYIVGLSVVTTDQNRRELQMISINTTTNQSQTQSVLLDLETEPRTVLADMQNTTLVIGGVNRAYIAPINHLISLISLISLP